MRIVKYLSTIRGRIALIYTLLFLIGFVFIIVLVSARMGGVLISQRTQAQQVEVENIAMRLAPYIYGLDAENMDIYAQSTAREISGRVILMDPDGIVQMDSHARLNGRALRHREVEDIRLRDQLSSYGFHRVEAGEGGLFSTGREWAVYYTCSIVYQSRNVGILLVSVPIQDLILLIRSTLNQFILITLVIVAGLIAASILVARWISLPVQQLTGAIRKMSHGEFNTRVQVSGATEMNQLAHTFNMMSERLENLDKIRSEFVANASHELKTPLSTIKILAESLLYQEEAVDVAVYREFLADINAQIDRLSSLLNDLLGLMQAEHTERESLAWEPVMLDELFERTLHSLHPLADEYGVTLYANPCGRIIQADKGLLSSALFNLVTNGIKYTPKGGRVHVSARIEETAVHIDVADTGIGIPPEDQPHIFERFYRVDKARSRETGGTGLGLSIVQQICRLHGGSVRVQSEIGQGSTFTVTLPQAGGIA